ncbi:MAG: PQQ-binding-like beta-propeller repeat protein [Planctomycetota bacterium]
MPHPSFLSLTIVLLAGPPSSPAAPTAPDGWPWWRGPDHDGVSKETGWSVDGVPLWERNVGLGYSTVSVHDGRLYTTGHDPEKQQDTLVCLDARSGEVVWGFSFPAKTWNMGHGGGSLSTPSVDGDVVFASHREGDLYCLDAKTGAVRWQHQLCTELDLKPPTWGFAASPLVFDDMVVMNAGVVLAFDKAGKPLWKSARSFGHAYSTPAPFEWDGRSLLAVFCGSGLVVVDRAKGEEIAAYEWKTKYDINAATPVVVGNRIFISSGYNHGCAMLELGAQKLTSLWESKAMRNQMSGCVLYEDHLYGLDEQELKCLDLTGKEVWTRTGFGKGCLLLAGGRLLVMSGEGELVIATATPGGYEELSRRKVLDGGVFWTTPVLASGLIYCRNSKGDLVCLDHRPKEG